MRPTHATHTCRFASHSIRANVSSSAITPTGTVSELMSRSAQPEKRHRREAKCTVNERGRRFLPKPVTLHCALDMIEINNNMKRNKSKETRGIELSILFNKPFRLPVGLAFRCDCLSLRNR